ncbi:unnamed protein product [Amoebophrya sp. A25]|nr:unnamed protein product [Amoebophrya sp. A25]|eukprot:GSA25T00023102001.1
MGGFFDDGVLDPAKAAAEAEALAKAEEDRQAAERNQNDNSASGAFGSSLGTAGKGTSTGLADGPFGQVGGQIFAAFNKVFDLENEVGGEGKTTSSGRLALALNPGAKTGKTAGGRRAAEVVDLFPETIVEKYAKKEVGDGAPLEAWDAAEFDFSAYAIDFEKIRAVLFQLGGACKRVSNFKLEKMAPQTLKKTLYLSRVDAESMKIFPKSDSSWLTGGGDDLPSLIADESAQKPVWRFRNLPLPSPFFKATKKPRGDGGGGRDKSNARGGGGNSNRGAVSGEAILRPQAEVAEDIAIAMQNVG